MLLWNEGLRNTIRVSNGFDPDRLTWVQPVSNSYQQMTKVLVSKERVKLCRAEYFCVLHSSPIFILLTCSIPVVSIFFSIRVKYNGDPDQMTLTEEGAQW